MDGIRNLPTLQKINISLRTKTVVAFLVLLIGFVLMLYVLSRAILLNDFEAIEHKLAEEDLQRLNNVMADEFDELHMVSEDWSYWDDTYQFVYDGNQTYIDNNLGDTTFESLELNLMLFINSSGEVVYGKAYRLDEHYGFELSSFLIEQYLNLGPLSQYANGLANIGQYGSGIVITPLGPMTIAMQDILTSEQTGPSRGILIMGRYLDQTALGNLAITATVDLDLRYYNDSNLAPEFRSAREHLKTAGQHYISALDNNRLAAYMLVNDITGQPALILQVTIPRDVYRRAADTIYFFLIAVFMGGLLLLVSTLYILERQVLARVLRLHRLAQMIGSTGNLTQRIPVSGGDELAHLALSMNGMLDTVQRTQHFLAEAQRRTQTIITSISDVIYVAEYSDKRMVSHQFLSPQIADLTGYPVERFQDEGAFWHSLVVPGDREFVQTKAQAALALSDSEVEYRIATAGQGERWIRDSIHAETRDDGIIVVYGVLSDITTRKAYQASLAERERIAHAFQEDLKALIEVSVDLSKVAHLDELYRQTVALGYERLGFKRLELFLLDDDGTTMVGAYGIDAQGQVRDARMLRRPVADDPVIAAALKDRHWTNVRSTGGTAAREKGEQDAFVTLWSDSGAVGWLAVDLHSPRTDTKPYENELLSLFGTTISHLITRARAQTALHESEARHRTLFENAHDAIMVLRDSVYVDCNPRAVELFGYSREQLIGQSPYFFSPSRQPDGQNSREKVRKLLKLAREGQPQMFEWRHICADGSLLDTEITLSHMEVAEEGLMLAMVRDITERRRSEQALRESEERYSALFNRMPVELYRAALDGRLLDVNPALVALLGYDDAASLRNLSMEKFFTEPELYAQWKSTLDVADGVRDLEIELRRQDGSVFWAQDTSRLVCDETGQPLYYEGHIRDITARKQAQDALAEERNLLRTLLDSMPDRIYVKNVRGEILLSNNAYALAVGQNTDADLIGKTDFDIYPESLAARYYADDVSVMETGIPLVNRIEPAYLSEDTARIWLTSTKVPLRSAQGIVIGLVSIGHDITALREIQEALSQSQERLNMALEAAGLGLWDWYIPRDQVVFNERWAEISGHEAINLGQKPRIWETLVCPEDWPEVETRLKAHLAGETPLFEAEYRIMTPAGEKWVLDRGKVMHRDADGNPLRMTGTLGDITARKRSEAEREQMLKQMRGRADELATVAEVSQQLTGILDIDQLLWELCDVVKERFDLYHAHVYLLDESGARLNLAAGFGVGGRRMVEASHYILVAHINSLVARAARLKEPVVVNDVTLDHGFLPNIWLPKTRAEMALPMVIGSELIGVLDVQDARVNRFSEEDIHILMTLAAQLAIAIANARLFSENARRLAIIEHSNDAIALIDARSLEGTPHYINPAGLHMLGYESMEQVVDKTIQDFYAPEFWDYIHNTVFPTLLASGSWRGEMALINLEGKRIPVEQTAFMIYDEQGNPRDLATLITDIAERKQSENALRRANRAYRTLSDCNQVMVGATDELELLREICEIIVTSGGYQMAWVGLIDPVSDDSSVAHPVAWAGNVTGYLNQLVTLRTQNPEWADPARRAIISGESVMIADMHTDETFLPGQPLAQEYGFQSAIALPLVSGGHGLGALTVYSNVPNAFDEQEIALLSELANDLAYGVMMLRTRLERQSAIEQTQQLNLQLALRNRQLLALHDAGRILMATLDVSEIYRVLYREVVQPVFGAQILIVTSFNAEHREITCEFAIIDGEERNVAALSPQPLDNGIVPDNPSRQTIRTGQPRVIHLPVPQDELASQHCDFHFNPSRPPRVGIYVPMIIGGSVVGAVGVQHHVENAFDDHDVRMLSAVVNQATVAIQNARLFAAERDQRGLAEALQAAAAAVNSSLDLDVVLDRILANIQRVVPHDAASIMLIEDGVGHVVRHIGFSERGQVDFVHSLRLPQAKEDEGYQTHWQLGLPLLIGDTYESPYWQRLEETDWIRSYIGAPIRFGDNLVGVLNLDSATPGFFSAEHALRAQAFADQVAIAVQNAQLFAAEHEQRQFAESLRDVAATINLSLEREDVFSELLANIKLVIPHDAATLMLLEGNRVVTVRSSGFEAYGLTEWAEQLSFVVDEHRVIQALIETGDTIIINDTSQYPGWVDFPATEWERACLTAPIRWERQVMGFLNLYSTETGFFTSKHAERLQAFAYQAANAIRNLQLFDAEREQRVLAEALRDTIATINSTLDPAQVLDRILTNVERVVPHDAANIMLVDNGYLAIARVHGYLERGIYTVDENWRVPLDWSPFLYHIVTEGQGLLLSDTSKEPLWDGGSQRESFWIRASLKAPIKLGDQVIGVINLDTAAPNSFTQVHFDLLQIFADYAAAAIRNARLFAAEREQRILSDVLRDTAETLSRSLEFDEVLDRILTNMKRVFPNDASNVSLFDDEDPELLRVVRHHGYEKHGPYDDIDSFAVNYKESELLKQAYDTSEPIIVEDARVYANWPKTPALSWIRGHVVVSIVWNDQVIGFLSMDSVTPGSFNDLQSPMLRIFANQAAIAVQNARLFTSEREQRRFAEALRDTAETLSRSLEFDEVLDRILANIKRVFPHDGANVSLFDEETGLLHIVRSHGYQDREMNDWARTFALDYTESKFLTLAYETGEPVVVSDVKNDPDWVVPPELSWVHAHATVSIIWDEQIIGFLSLDSEQPGAFDGTPPSVLRILANQAAIAVQNARLFTSEREQRRFAEALRDTAAAINRTLEFDRVLDFVLANTKRVLPHDAANIMLIEDGVARVVRGHGYDQYDVGDYVRNLRLVAKDVEVWRTMLETGTPFAIPDTLESPEWPKHVPEEYWIRSTVKAPIRVEGRTIGIVHLDSATPGTFTQAHAELLQAFADQAAVALRNAEFFAAEHAQRTLAEALRDSTSAINSTLDFAEVLDRILIFVGRVVPYDSANVLLVEGNEVRIAAQYPEQMDPEIQAWRETFRFELDQTPNLKYMYDTGEPVIESCAKENDEWVPVGPLGWIEASVGAPIRHEGKVLGFITLDSDVPDFFTDLHAERLQAFADQTAIAIRNAQLFEAVQQHAAELEQRVAERTYEVEQHSAQLRAILDSITEGVIYDEKLAVKYSNRALLQLTGYESGEFTRYIDILRSARYSPDTFAEMIHNVYNTVQARGVWQGDLWVQRKDQSEFEAALTVTEVRNVEGEIVGAVSVLRDVSQEKELQRQRDRFIASASHELRTPLTNFKTRLYLLKAQPTKATQHLMILNQVANNMVDLVESLLDVSRFERGVIALHRRRTLLQELVGNVVEVQQAEAERKGIVLAGSLPSEELYANVDPARMQQVITNLISNAINYTPETGTITVTLERDGDQVLLRVSDTGIGIDTAQVSHIFEPFFRANEEAAEGTGLGLTIAKEIVHLHDGKISVTSAKGKGSTFTVALAVME